MLLAILLPLSLSQREGDFVRSLQTAALLSCQDDESELEVVRTANAMRKVRRPLGDWERKHSLNLFFPISSGPGGQPSSSTLSPVEHLATFRWLFPSQDEGDDSHWLRVYYVAALEEAAGQQSDAADYNLVLTHIPRCRTAWQ